MTEEYYGDFHNNAIFAGLGVALYIAEKTKPGSSDSFGKEYKWQQELKRSQRIRLNSRGMENEINKIRNAEKANGAWRR